MLSKSFDVLKAAVTPRVLPSGMTLSKTNARLTVFGLVAGLVFGGVAGGFAKLFGSPGALWFTAVLCVADAVLCMRDSGLGGGHRGRGARRRCGPSRAGRSGSRWAGTW